MFNFMFNFVQRRRVYFIFSGTLITLGILSIIYSLVSTGQPFRLSVDFQGGTRFEIRFTEPVTESQIRNVFAEFAHPETDVTALGDEAAGNFWQVRTEYTTPEQAQEIIAALSDQVAPVDNGATSVQSVSSTIGSEVTRAAFVAIAISAIIVLFYIMFSFRQVPNSIRFGACAVAAMLHDLTIIFGFISIMGIFFGWEVDALFLTAALTVAGFSLQDTIVVFDRIRENSQRRPNENYERLVNRSVLETIHRSLATQLNAMFVLVAILLFGGASIRPFIAVLFVGLLSGTYSSIFNAVPLLVAWEKGEIPFLKPA
ncbi:MAG: protein translocase subunit SecF [Candidatus Promineifilaceae bacterium]